MADWVQVGRVSGVCGMTILIPGRPVPAPDRLLAEGGRTVPMAVTILRCTLPDGRRRGAIRLYRVHQTDAVPEPGGYEFDEHPVIVDEFDQVRVRAGGVEWILHGIPGEALGVERGPPDGESHMLAYLRTWRTQNLLDGFKEWAESLLGLIVRRQEKRHKGAKR